MRSLLKFVVLISIGFLAASGLSWAQARMTADQGNPGRSGPWPTLLFGTGPGGSPVAIQATAAGAIDVALAAPATSGGASVEVLCLTASSVVLTAGAAARSALNVQNLGPNPIYVCPAATCTTGTGVQVAKGTSASFDVGISPTFSCVADTANQIGGAGTRVMEIW